jgi:hypothetical protein
MTKTYIPAPGDTTYHNSARNACNV